MSQKTQMTKMRHAEDAVENLMHNLIDSLPRCRCGKLKSETSSGCVWHAARNENKVSDV